MGELISARAAMGLLLPVQQRVCLLCCIAKKEKRGKRGRIHFPKNLPNVTSGRLVPIVNILQTLTRYTTSTPTLPKTCLAPSSMTTSFRVETACWLVVDWQPLYAQLFYMSKSNWMPRNRHPKKVVEDALRYAESNGWRVEIDGRQIRRVVDNCTSRKNSLLGSKSWKHMTSN